MILCQGNQKSCLFSYCLAMFSRLLHAIVEDLKITLCYEILKMLLLAYGIIFGGCTNGYDFKYSQRDSFYDRKA